MKQLAQNLVKYYMNTNNCIPPNYMCTYYLLCCDCVLTPGDRRVITVSKEFSMDQYKKHCCLNTVLTIFHTIQLPSAQQGTQYMLYKHYEASIV